MGKHLEMSDLMRGQFGGKCRRFSALGSWNGVRGVRGVRGERSSMTLSSLKRSEYLMLQVKKAL